MSRKRTTKDFAISMDEFHPRPSTAAAFADRKANDATQEHIAADIKRVIAKIEADPDPPTSLFAEKRRLEDLMIQTKADRARIDELIAEAKVK